MSQPRNRRTNRRSVLRMESLERRNLLAGDVLHNYLEPSDVNDDHAVTAVDALAIINRLNRESSGSIADGEQHLSEGYWDVNDDGHSTAADALVVINQLNLDATPTGNLVAHIEGGQGERVQMELEDSDSKLAVKLQNAVPNAVYDVTVDSAIVGQVHTEESGRGVLEIHDSYFSSLGAGSTVSVSGIGSASLESSDDSRNDLGNDSVDSGSVVDGDNGNDDVGVVGSTTNTESNDNVNESFGNASNDTDAGQKGHGSIPGGDSDADDLPVVLPPVLTTPVVTPSVGTTTKSDDKDGEDDGDELNHSKVNDHGVGGHDDHGHDDHRHEDHDD